MDKDNIEDKVEFVRLGDPSIRRISLEGQTQYLARYVHWYESEEMRAKNPNLGEGLRFRNLDGHSHHDIEIHRDDIPEFIGRVNRYMVEQGMSDPAKVDNDYLRIQ